MTKICMLSSGHSPLDDRIYYKETFSLASKFPTIYIVAPAEESNIKVDNSIEFVPLRKGGSILRRLLNIPTAIKTVVKLKPQICHFHDYELIFALPFLRLFSKCKIIYDVHEAYPEMAEASSKIPKLMRPFIVRFVDFSEKIMARLTDYIIAADDKIAERFNTNHHVVTIFNYPRLSLFVPDSDRLSQLKKRYESRIPIIYQGGMSTDRGLFKMIDAMSILKSKRPEIILLLVGEMNDDLLKKAITEIGDKGLKNSIDIVGWIPHKDVVNYIYVSKIGLVPLLPIRKYLKNIPIKQFEYMACGIPVLGANLPPIESYITAAGCGKVYDSTRAEALASGIIYILESELEWKRMSEAGEKAVKDLWNWDKMEERLLAVYDNLLSSA